MKDDSPWQRKLHDCVVFFAAKITSALFLTIQTDSWLSSSYNYSINFIFYLNFVLFSLYLNGNQLCLFEHDTNQSSKEFNLINLFILIQNYASVFQCLLENNRVLSIEFKIGL